MKIKLHIWDDGDAAVGIAPTESIVTIEDNYTDNDVALELLKEFFKEYYDNAMINIMTEGEYEQHCMEESKMAREIWKADKSRKICGGLR